LLDPKGRETFRVLFNQCESAAHYNGQDFQINKENLLEQKIINLSKV